MERGIALLAGFVRRKPWLLVFGVLVVTVLASFPLAKFPTKPNADDLLPAFGIKARNLINKTFPGGTQPLVLLVDARHGNILHRDNLLELSRLSAHLRSSPRTRKMFPASAWVFGPHRVVELFLQQVNAAVQGRRLFARAKRSSREGYLFGALQGLLEQTQKEAFFRRLFKTGAQWQRARAQADELKKVMRILTLPLAVRPHARNWLGEAFDKQRYLRRLSRGSLRLQDLRQDQIYAIFRYALAREPDLRLIFSRHLRPTSKRLETRYAVLFLARERKAIQLGSEESDIRVIDAIGAFNPSVHKVTVFGGIDREMERDQAKSRILLLICILIICGVLFHAFRSVVDVLLPLFGVILVNIWMFGAAGLLGFGFSMLTIMAPILSLALGVDYALQSLSRYREEIGKGAEIGDALEASISSVGGALLLSTVTTVAGFLASLLSPITAIAHFGGTVAVGIAASFVILGLFVPVVRFLLDRRRVRQGKPLGYPGVATGEASQEEDATSQEASAQGAADASAQAFGRSWVGRGLLSLLTRPKQLVIGALLVTIGFLAFALHLQSQFDWRVMLSDSSPVAQATNTLLKQFPQAMIGRVDVMVRGDLGRARALRALDAMVRNTADDAHTARTGRGEPRVLSILPSIRAVCFDPALRQRLGLQDRDRDGLPDTDKGAKRVLQYLLDKDKHKGATPPVRNKASKGATPTSKSAKPSSRPVPPSSSRRSSANKGIAAAVTKPGKNKKRPATSRPAVSLSFSVTSGAGKAQGGTGAASASKESTMQVRPPLDISSVLSHDRKATLVRVDVTGSFSGSRYLREIHLALKADLAPLQKAGLRTELGGMPTLNHLVNDTIVNDLMRSIALTLLICFLILVLVLRSGFLGLLNVVPVTLVIIWVLGMMKLLGYDLNVLTAMIMALCVGVGIDFSIHITHRYSEERLEGYSIPDAVLRAVAHLGSAMLYATLTSALGFGVLVFTQQAALRAFAILVFLVISFSFCLSIFLMPVLLAWYDRKRNPFSNKP